MIARFFFGAATTEICSKGRRFPNRHCYSSLKKSRGPSIYPDEIHLLRTCLFRRPGQRESIAVRSVHLAEPALEEDRREQSRRRFHPGLAWAWRSCRGRGRYREPNPRESYCTI